MRNRLERNITKAGNMLVIGMLAVTLSGCFTDLPDETSSANTPIPLELSNTTKPTTPSILQEEPMIEVGLDSQSGNFTSEWPSDFKNSLPFHIEGEPIDAPGSEWYSGEEVEPGNTPEEEGWVEDEPVDALAGEWYSVRELESGNQTGYGEWSMYDDYTGYDEWYSGIESDLGTQPEYDDYTGYNDDYTEDTDLVEEVDYTGYDDYDDYSEDAEWVEEEIWAEDEDTADIIPDDFNYETEVTDPIPSFIINDGFGGFMGFNVRVTQDSETGNLSVTGIKGLPTFAGSFLLVLDSDKGECVVMEIPTSLLNQYDYHFELEVLLNEQSPTFSSFRFLTNYHVRYSEFEPLLSETITRWFSHSVSRDQWHEITEELVLSAGWLTLDNFTYRPEENTWFLQATCGIEGIEQHIINILFMDEDGTVLLEFSIDPQFYLFELGEVRWLDASNDEDLSLVHYVAIGNQYAG